MARRTTIMSEKYIERFTKELQKLSDGLAKKGTIKNYDKNDAPRSRATRYLPKKLQLFLLKCFVGRLT